MRRNGLLLVLIILVGAIVAYYLLTNEQDRASVLTTVTEEFEDAEGAVERVAAPAVEDRAADVADAGLIPREHFFGNPTRAQLRLSPDGQWVSFLAPLDGVLNVYLAPADDIDAASPITSDDGRGISSHFWAHNGTHVLYIQDRGGDENFRLYAVNLESGETTDLTPFEETRVYLVGGSRHHPDEMLIGLNNRDARWHDVHRINVVTGELTLLEKNTNELIGFIADRDLNVRLAAKTREDGGYQYFKRTPTGWAEFFVVPQEDSLSTNPLGFTADGQGIYMLDSRGRNTAALVEMSFETGETSIIAESDLADVSSIITHPETYEILAYAVNYDRVRWNALNPGMADDLNFLGATLAGDITVTSMTNDASKWTLFEQTSDSVGSFHIYDRQSRTVTRLFSIREELEGLQLSKMHPVIIRSRDGLDLVSYLTLPPASDRSGDGRPDEAVPLVLLVHGGPWARDSYGFSGTSQWLANRGYAVLQVNFRGSTGFGKDFINAGDLEWGRRMHDDLIDAVEWAVAEGITTEDQIAIMGGSYGGYATLVGLTFTPEIFACGVNIVGPSNLETLLATIPPYWAAFFEQFATRVGDPRTEEGRALLRERSPLHYADRIQRPLLIAQGANDPRVKQAESDQIVAAMQENGLPVTYVLYPDEGHGFARPQNRLSFFAITEAFLSDCLGGEMEPIGTAFDGSSTTVPEGADLVPGLAAALDGFEPLVRQ
jgi:dipeptidyl aminopeptidase/acylaminoacyl peptidase